MPAQEWVVTGAGVILGNGGSVVMGYGVAVGISSMEPPSVGVSVGVRISRTPDGVARGISDGIVWFVFGAAAAIFDSRYILSLFPKKPQMPINSTRKITTITRVFMQTKVYHSYACAFSFFMGDNTTPLQMKRSMVWRNGKWRGILNREQTPNNVAVITHI